MGIVALLAAGIMQVAPVGPVASAADGDIDTAVVSGRADSARLLRTARNAQASFEARRRMHLPRGMSGSRGECTIRVGRYCYWRDDRDPIEPPPEAPAIRDAREGLLATLEAAAGQLPGDGWVAGQRVRYLMEAGAADEALAVALDCRADTAWCDALTGYVHHLTGDFPAADAAFRRALHAMPEEEHCRWMDLSAVLEDDLGRAYRAADCTERARMAERIWWAAAPLYLVGAADLRTEHLARVTRTRLEFQARRTDGSSWGDDIGELIVRYGWSEWHSRSWAQFGSTAEIPITGHRVAPGLALIPAARAVDSIGAARANDWDLRNLRSASAYGPRYAHRILELPHQIARFQRGDSMLVVAAFDASGNSVLANAALEGGLFVTPEPGVMAGAPTTVAARHRLSTMAPARESLVSLELLARDEKHAARARVGVLPAAGRRIAVSDLLLYRPDGESPAHLDDALPRALTDLQVDRRQPLGLFWEIYGVRPEGETIGTSLTVERIGTSFWRRAAEALRLVDGASTMNVRWQEVPRRGTTTAGRGVSVDLSRLQPGRYRIQLTLAPAREPPVVATRDIVVE